MEESWPHAVELGHSGTPLRVHTDNWSADQLTKLLALSFIADELDLDVSRQSEGGTLGHWPKLIDRHVVKLGVVLDPGHVSLKSLTRIVVLSEVVALPDTCSFLEVHRGNLIITVCLGLLQISLLEQLFN